MKIYEKVKTQSARLVETKCDLCREASASSEGGKASHQDAYTTISYREGVACPDGSIDVKRVDVDLCPSCFRDKLVPFLESQRAVIEVV